MDHGLTQMSRGGKISFSSLRFLSVSSNTEEISVKLVLCINKHS
jgi:hypothetical protein